MRVKFSVRQVDKIIWNSEGSDGLFITYPSNIFSEMHRRAERLNLCYETDVKNNPRWEKVKRMFHKIIHSLIK